MPLFRLYKIPLQLLQTTEDSQISIETLEIKFTKKFQVHKTHY